MRLPLPSVRTDCFPGKRTEQLLPESVTLPQIRGWSLYQGPGLDSLTALMGIYPSDAKEHKFLCGTGYLWCLLLLIQVNSYITHFWNTCSHIAFLFKTMRVILSFSLKAVKIVKSINTCVCREKNPKSYPILWHSHDYYCYFYYYKITIFLIDIIIYKY